MSLPTQAECVNTSAPLFSVQNVRKTYGVETRPALAIDRATIPGGKIVAILGNSGSGKTTLLNLLSLLDSPDHGSGENAARTPEICLHDSDSTQNLLALQPEEALERRATFGFVFQLGYLIHNLTSTDNVKVPVSLAGFELPEGTVESMASSVGLDGNKASRHPAELSAGECQRFSVLRALSHGPKVIFADEPTSSLDEENARTVLIILRDWCHAQAGRTVLLVTHNLLQAAEFADSVLVMAGGHIAEEFDLTLGTNRRSLGEHYKLTTERLLARSTGTGKGSGNFPMIERGKRRSLWAFAATFAFSDVFPRAAAPGRPAWYARTVGFVNSQWHNLVSLFLAITLALFFCSVQYAVNGYLECAAGDPRINNIPVLSTIDRNPTLSPEDLKALQSLEWAREGSKSRVATADEIQNRALVALRPAIIYSAGSRVRPIRFIAAQGAQDLLSDSKTLDAIAMDLDDPILDRIELLSGSDLPSMMPNSNTVRSAINGVRKTTALSGAEAQKPLVVITKGALEDLGFNQPPPELIVYSLKMEKVSLQTAGVADWLPYGARAMIADSTYLRFFAEVNTGDRVPGYSQITVYVKDILQDGIPVAAELERMRYKLASNLRGRLEWTVSVTRSVGAFSLMASVAIALFVLVALAVFYTQAIRRKEKEIAVLLAYGIRGWMLQATFLLEVGIVWFLAVAIAMPIHQVVGSIVSVAVQRGLGSSASCAAPPSTVPLPMVGLVTLGSLAIGVAAASYAVSQLQRRRIADILRGDI